MNLKKILGMKNTIVVCNQEGDKLEWQRHVFQGNTYVRTEYGITPTSEEYEKYRAGKHRANLD